MTGNDYRINWKQFRITQEGEGTIVHPLVALALTPIIGLAFLMFLPFIGFYLTIQAAGLKLGKLFMVPVPPQPVVGAAFLTGEEPKKVSSSLTEDLENLHADIQKRRESSK